MLYDEMIKHHESGSKETEKMVKTEEDDLG
jgi:hypothetical protein